MVYSRLLGVPIYAMRMGGFGCDFGVLYCLDNNQKI